MKTKKVQDTFNARSTLAVVTILTLLAPLLCFGVNAQKKQRLSDEQRIVHVLNRLGFGARPGDVERVKAMGLENYINQQLNPEKLDDSLAETKIKSLPTLTMTTAQLYEKFPQPAMLLRQLERSGELPAELREARRTAPTSNAQAGTSISPDLSTSPNSSPPPRAQDNQEYRRALREYYQRNGLQQPQRIIAELQASRILRAAYSERQLNEVMVDFWSNHFNVFANKGADRWLLTSYDRDTIRPHAMGKFSDLLVATAKSPAMLFYLDNFQSVSPQAPQRRDGPVRQSERNPHLNDIRRDRQERLMNSLPNVRQPVRNNPQTIPNAPQRTRRGINENYARELMELHTLGVDGGYTQKDVQEVARCFTGWTIFAPRGGGAALAALMGNGARESAGTFFFNARTHDDGEKTVLGHKIPAGGGIKDGLLVLEILARHQSTARYISQKLVRHFVMDSPPPTLVDRVANAFTKSNGDIRETLKAIFLSPEFYSPEAYRAKIKRPFELAISAVRTLGADTNGGPQLHRWIARMGEPLYGFQTPNGYSDAAESWVNTGGLLERMNFGLALASNRIPGTRVDLKRFIEASEKNFNNTQVMDRFLNVLIAGEISGRTKETLLKKLAEPVEVTSSQTPTQSDAMSRPVTETAPRARAAARNEGRLDDPVTKVVGLILGTPEFQRQ